MKKILAILLTAAMIVAMFAAMVVPASADAVSLAVNAFNPDSVASGVSAIFTTSYTIDGYQENVAFQLVSGNTYKVVEMSGYDWNETQGDILASALSIPSNGFVWVIQWQADNGDIDTACRLANAMKVGEEYVIEGLDLANGRYTTVTATGKASDSVDTGDAPAADATKTLGLKNNVAAGKSYTTSGLYRQNPTTWEYDETAAPAYDDEAGKSLTDDIVANDGSYANVAWAGLHYGTPDATAAGYVFVNVDLGEATDITECQLYVPVVGYDAAAGVTGPEAVTFFGSVDGETYTELGAATISNYSDFVALASLKIETNVKYVEARWLIGGWCFVSEIAVIGTEKADDNTGDDNTGDDNTGDDNTGDDNTGDDNTGDDNTGDDDTNVDEPTVDVEDVVGEENADGKFVAEITAPDTYKAGEEVIVTVTINDVTADLHSVQLDLFYDVDKLELTNPPVAPSTAVKAFKVIGEWEDFTKVKTLEDGTSYIFVNAATAGNDDGTITTVSEDGQLVFEISFTAKADATGDIAVYGTNSSVKGKYVDGTTGTIADYVGNTNAVVIAEAEEEVVEPDVPATEDEPATDDEPTTDKPGDASSIVFFAIIALVAIAGSAVVIKTRK